MEVWGLSECSGCGDLDEKCSPKALELGFLNPFLP